MPRSLNLRPVALILALIGLVAGGFGIATSARAAEFTDGQKAEMGAVIRDYLLKNPEVLREAMTELDRRQKAEEVAHREQTVGDNAGDLFNAPNGVVIGNPSGKVTLVEFFDYNCGYCRKTLSDIAELMKTEPELRIVLKDFPVLGPGSVEAAQIASAVSKQLHGDAFWQFHSKLLGTHGPVGKAQALEVAKESGVDMDRMMQDASGAPVTTGLQKTMQLADALNLTGTPSFVLGHEVVVGAVGYDELKGRIDNVLKCGKAMCS